MSISHNSMPHNSIGLHTTSQPSRQLIRLRKTGDGPVYGCDLKIEVRAPGLHRTIEKHWVGSVSKCVSKAKYTSHFYGITEIEALTFERWVAAYGDPAMKRES